MTPFSDLLESTGARPARGRKYFEEDHRAVAMDLQDDIQALGREFLATDGEVPEWLLDDTYLALVGQGVLTE